MPRKKTGRPTGRPRLTPEEKVARRQAAKALKKELKQATSLPLRTGTMTETEQKLVDAMVADAAQQGDAGLAALETQAQALGLVLRRSKTAVRNAFDRAKQRLRENADRYAELHLEAAEVAAKKGDAAPTQWALERITADGDEGKPDEHIVRAPGKDEGGGQTVPIINIGIALGGTPKDVKVIDVTPDDPDEAA